MSLTAELVGQILKSEPDESARERARTGISDFIAVLWPVLRCHVFDSGLPALKRVYHDDLARTRALLLGYAGHALDFDDFHADFRGHPSTVILPALLAVAAYHQVSVQQFLDAYIIGVEMAGRLGLAASQQHYTLGHHNTATLGTVAAAAAVARLLQTNEKQTAVLLGLAATQASGLRAQFGSAVKPLHAGYAAERAVSAAELALAGFDGKISGVIEGFLITNGGGKAQPERLLQEWATPWRIVTPGLEFKPFATCSGTHSAAEAAQQLRQQWLAAGGTLQQLLAEIADITVAFPPGGDIAASVREPQNGIEARFSLEYVIAAMLIYNDLRLPDFAEGEVNADISALAKKVVRLPDGRAPPDADDPSQRFHIVTLSLKDGRMLSARQTRKASLATPVNVAEKLQLALQNESASQQQALTRFCALQKDDDLIGLTTALITALGQPMAD